MELLLHLVCKLWCVWVGLRVLRVRVGHGLTESSPHGDVVGKVSCKSPVKVGVGCLKVCGKTAVLHRQVVVLFLVHLFVDDILLGDLERTTRPSFVDL